MYVCPGCARLCSLGPGYFADGGAKLDQSAHSVDHQLNYHVSLMRPFQDRPGLHREV